MGDGDLADLKSVRLLGVRIDNVDTAGALAIIEEFIHSRTPHLVVTADASCLVLAQRDRELLNIVNSADLVTPDSVGILWAARLRGTPLRERVSGVDIVEVLCERARRCGHRVFLLGSALGVAEAAAENLRQRYPGVAIVGTHHGYFAPDEGPGVVEKVRSAAPDVLFVALGIPRQEKWIRRYLEQLGVPVCMGVGGSLDVISGRVSRAPRWMQQHGLEWMFRLVRNPRKIGKVMTLPRFVALVLWSHIADALARYRG